jgi:hypothetical protein
MRQFLFAQMALVTLALVITGCSGVPQRSSGLASSTPGSPAAVSAGASVSTRNTDVAERIGAADIGSVVSLPNQNPLGVASLVVSDTYTSASNRVCRRMRSLDGRVLSRVACQRSSGLWYLSRSLKNRAAQRILDTAAALSNIVVVPASSISEIIMLRLRENETLWSFAERVTGSAQNWGAIARHNAVDDAATLEAGVLLRVPAELFVVGQ